MIIKTTHGCIFGGYTDIEWQPETTSSLTEDGGMSDNSDDSSDSINRGTFKAKANNSCCIFWKQ